MGAREVIGAGSALAVVVAARTDRFDLRLPGRGTSTTISFSGPGVYHYFCDRHPSMRGEIRVNPSEP